MSISVGDAVMTANMAARKRWAVSNNRVNGSGGAARNGRVLLVEDEALVAMMMTDFLRDIGFHVIGPFGRVSEAIDALAQEQPQAAILDINLRGELIYDLADELTGRGIPIVFVTGYGADAVDRRFADFPVLQKPVDSAALRRVLVAPKAN
jgi:two-component SAPR family response regulator